MAQPKAKDPQVVSETPETEPVIKAGMATPSNMGSRVAVKREPTVVTVNGTTVVTA
jgi:hypothetical protein